MGTPAARVLVAERILAMRLKQLRTGRLKNMIVKPAERAMLWAYQERRQINLAQVPSEKHFRRRRHFLAFDPPKKPGNSKRDLVPVPRPRTAVVRERVMALKFRD